MLINKDCKDRRSFIRRTAEEFRSRKNRMWKTQLLIVVFYFAAAIIIGYGFGWAGGA
jgi:hypothetical protein